MESDFLRLSWWVCVETDYDCRLKIKETSMGFLHQFQLQQLNPPSHISKHQNKFCISFLYKLEA